MTPDEYKAALAAPKRQKFGAKPITVDGEFFHSTGEAKRYGDLKNLERAGEIRDLKRQVRFTLSVSNGPILLKSKRSPKGVIASYIADFTYFEGEEFVIEDFKGHDTPESRLKRAIVEAMTDCTIRITGARK